MSNAVLYNTIRKTVQSCLPGSRVVLFGSHARGDQDRLSDYDLLIITPTKLSSKDKIKWSSRLDRAIVEAAGVPVDLLLNSEEEIVEKQQLPGHIIRTAIREGVQL